MGGKQTVYRLTPSVPEWARPSVELLQIGEDSGTRGREKRCGRLARVANGGRVEAMGVNDR